MIAAVSEDFFASFLDAWDSDGKTFTPELRRHYIDSSAAAVPSIVADFRASSGVDLELDRADREAGRKLEMPLGVLSQNWGAQLGFDPTAIWGAWSDDLAYQPIDAGHYLAEERPDDVVEFVQALWARARVRWDRPAPEKVSHRA